MTTNVDPLVVIHLRDDLAGNEKLSFGMIFSD